MQAVGSALFFLFMVLTMALLGPLAVIAWLLPFGMRTAIARFWANMQLGALRVLCRLDYTVEGRENIPANQPVIVLSKHQSAWETIALQSVLGPQTWVLKRELMWIPIFGWALAAMRSIAIDRSAGKVARQQVIDQGRQRLDEGISIIIFPEGTRIPPRTAKRFGLGGALLAEATGAPVLPIAHNAGTFWRRRGFMKLPGTVQMVIGPPIESKGRAAADINDSAYRWMQNMMARLEQPAQDG